MCTVVPLGTPYPPIYIIDQWLLSCFATSCAIQYIMGAVYIFEHLATSHHDAWCRNRCVLGCLWYSMSTNLQDAASVDRERLLSSCSDCRNGCEVRYVDNDNAWKTSASPLLPLNVTHCIQAVGAYTEKGKCYSAMTNSTQQMPVR